ncbi:MAG: sensor domain-containing protein [Rhodanobacteraceae bacterium]
MTAPVPRTIEEYLQQLRAALRGADEALIQDALYDAEDHLRSEFADHPDVAEADLLSKIATSYGAPDEVADIYRDQEIKVARALCPPPPPPRKSTMGRFFGVGADARTYAAMFYMLLALPTGIFYFVWTVVGISLSLGTMILIIGLPLAALFIGTLRMLSLIEGRIVEVMLGERMPRRPLYSESDKPLLRRIGAMFTDPRTWSTMLYMLLRLPLGIAYFVIAVVGTVVPVAFVVAPVAHLLWGFGVIRIDGDTIFASTGYWNVPPIIVEPVLFLLGIVLLFTVLHLARGIGRFQGALAKHLLVRAPAG